jgi:hypothetical protein
VTCRRAAAHDGDVNCVAWQPAPQSDARVIAPTPLLLASAGAKMVVDLRCREDCASNAGDDNLVRLWRRTAKK